MAIKKEEVKKKVNKKTAMGARPRPPKKRVKRG